MSTNKKRQLGHIYLFVPLDLSIPYLPARLIKEGSGIDLLILL